ncbi:hypothetical protein MHU86_17445 [Fragilaria crotonensis]|nr:hypothetical protein MHU86_17445 [Fragilaria crotonensis]
MSSATEQEMWAQTSFPEVDNLGIEFPFGTWPPIPPPGAVNPFDELDEDGWNVYDKQRGEEWSFFLNNKPPIVLESSNTDNLDDLRQDVETPRSKNGIEFAAAASVQDGVFMDVFPRQEVTPLAKEYHHTAKIRPPPAPRVKPQNKVRHFISNDRTPMRLGLFSAPVKADDERRDDGVTPTSPLASPPLSPSKSALLHRAYLRSVRQLDEFCGTTIDDVKETGADDTSVESNKFGSDEPLSLAGSALDPKLARALSFAASPQMHQRATAHIGRRAVVDSGLNSAAKIEIADRFPKKVLVDRNNNEMALDCDSKTIMDSIVKAVVNANFNDTANRSRQQSENHGRDGSQGVLNLDGKKRIATGDVVADRHQWLMEAFKGKDQSKDKVETVSPGPSFNLPAKIDKRTTDMFGGQAKVKSAVQRRREEYEQMMEEKRAAAITPKLMVKTQWKNKQDGSYKKNLVKTIG